MSRQLVNKNNGSIKKCAFCRHWYDPTNAAIAPRAPIVGLWEFEPSIKAMCLLRNTETPGFHTCSKFDCKI